MRRLTNHRADRQMRGLENLGHHEGRQRVQRHSHGFRRLRQYVYVSLSPGFVWKADLNFIDMVLEDVTEL